MAAARAAKRVTLLGSTGSIGRQAEAVIAEAPGSYRVEALVAGRDVAALAAQARRLNPAVAVVADAQQESALAEALADTDIAIGAGPDAAERAAKRPADVVLAAIVGAAGLRPSLAAVHTGTTVALANKECLVCAGTLFMAAARASGATIIPVDSEHAAIFQVLTGRSRNALARLVLTASGGPFRQFRREALHAVTPDQAVAHPNWSMGAKISVDSATMMNKGLEIIEAGHLFDMADGAIDVLIHPESIVHSLVGYRDGAMLAELGWPDMRTPIAVAFAWPERQPLGVAQLDLAEVGQLTFSRPDPERFPALALARTALRTGNGAATVLNAANEIAVAAFLAREIGFLAIEDVVAATLDRLPGGDTSALDAIMALDERARATARAVIAGSAKEPG